MQWEYLAMSCAALTLDTSAATLAELNRLGAEGWELVTVRTHPASGDDEFLFKRLMLVGLSDPGTVIHDGLGKPAAAFTVGGW